MNPSARRPPAAPQRTTESDQTSQVLPHRTSRTCGSTLSLILHGRGGRTNSTRYELSELGPFRWLGLAGGDWELGIRTIRAFKNISLGLSGFDPTNGVVEMAVRELGAERLIYGSDSYSRSFASQMSKVMGADVSDEAKRLILGANLKRMLTPILKSKGLH